MRTRLAVLFAVLVGILAGCGGGGGSDPTPSPAPQQGATPPPTPTPVPAPRPTLDVFKVDPPPGILPFSGVNLVWSAVNADSCEASGAQGTSWFGTRSASGSEPVGGLSGGQKYAFNLMCTGPGGSVNGSVEVSVPLPPPPPPPPPTKAMSSCDTRGVSLSVNPQTNPDGFVSIKKECRIAAESPVAINEITVTVEGFGDKVLDVRMIDKVLATDTGLCRYTPTEVARTPVINGVATLTLKNFRLSRECQPTAPFSYGKSVSFELRLKPLDPLGVSEPFRDVRISVKTGSDIKTIEPVVFSNTFPLEVGFIRIAKGKVYHWKNNEIFRYDMATGVDTVLTYSYGSTYTPNGDIYPSADGKSIMFFRSIPYVMDTDGTGCTSADIPVVVSPGCNKGFKAIPLSTGGVSSFSPDGTMFTYGVSTLISPGGTLYHTDIYLAKVSPFSVEQITLDSYGGTSAVIGSTGVYFYSCRPGCGIYWTEVDFSTGKPVGVIKLIYACATGDESTYVLSSVSSDEKEFLLYSYHWWWDILDRVFSVNADGTNFREIGIGQRPKFASDGRIVWYDPQKGSVLADHDGGNQVLGADFYGTFALTP